MMIKSAQTSAIIARKRCKPFRCLRCAFSFGSRLELEEHINSHTGSKPFACNVCRKGFNRRSSLWNHNRIHMDFKPFICPLCNATFKWKNSLKCHRTTHIRHDPAMGKKFDLLSLNLKHLSFGSSCRKFGALPKRDNLGVSSRRSGLFDHAFDGEHPESLDARRERMIKDLLVKVEKQEVQEYNNAWFDKVFGSLHGSKNTDKPADQNEMTEAARAAENLLALKGVDLDEHCNNNNNDGVFLENCNQTINSIPKFGPLDNLNTIIDDKKFIKKLPFPVTKQEMEKVAQAHYANQSQFLFRNTDQQPKPSICMLLPKICILVDGTSN
uniref:C2H2-type domain-containing protein n=1 Tax=Romanomermis culicivorax TaxID=13658 RepID=A0A915LDF7_ROMCU